MYDVLVFVKVFEYFVCFGVMDEVFWFDGVEVVVSV